MKHSLLENTDRSWTGIMAGCGLLTAVFLCGLWTRPLLPIDETRYISVAWEMWHTGDFITPHLNGGFYSHKPPLLSWAICLLWSVFGVSETAARCVPFAAGLGCLILVSRLSRLLWPDHREAAEYAPVILGAMVVWSFFCSMLMFDVLLTFSVLAAHHQLLSGLKTHRRVHWYGYCLAIAGGILCKGPVLLVHTVPGLIAAGLLSGRRARRDGNSWKTVRKPQPGERISPYWIATLGGITIACVWVALACRSGGPEFARAILWKQSAERMVSSFAHARPWWWYLPILPVLALPWSLGLQPVRATLTTMGDRGLRFCLIAAGLTVLVLSLISGKQIHYPLPLVPLAALMAARTATAGGARIDPMRQRLFGAAIAAAAGVLMVPVLRPGLIPVLQDVSPFEPGAAAALLTAAGVVFLAKPAFRIRTAVYSIASTTGFGLCLVMLTLLRPALQDTDLRKPGELVARHLRSGHPVAVLEDYDGQLHFPGRVTAPFTVLTSAQERRAWESAHPDGLVIVFGDRTGASDPDTLVSVRYARDFRLRQLTVRRSSGSRFTRRTAAVSDRQGASGPQRSL